MRSLRLPFHSFCAHLHTIHCCIMADHNQSDITSTGTSLGSSSQLPSTSSYDRDTSGPLFPSVRSDSVSTNVRRMAEMAPGTSRR
uniref:Secreted protein n=1 Tax=Ascaris lumbricoides TaxID=6252 RepID=A0A0M3ID81_ASCLU